MFQSEFNNSIELAFPFFYHCEFFFRRCFSVLNFPHHLYRIECFDSIALVHTIVYFVYLQFFFYNSFKSFNLRIQFMKSPYSSQLICKIFLNQLNIFGISNSNSILFYFILELNFFEAMKTSAKHSIS